MINDNCCSEVVTKIAGLYAERLMSDVILVVGKQELAAHRLILAQLGPLAQLQSNSLLEEILREESFVTLAGWEPDTVSRMVSHLYTPGMFYSKDIKFYFKFF